MVSCFFILDRNTTLGSLEENTHTETVAHNEDCDLLVKKDTRIEIG